MTSQPVGGPRFDSLCCTSPAFGRNQYYLAQRRGGAISRKAYRQAVLRAAARSVGRCSAKQSQLTADGSCETKPIRGLRALGLRIHGSRSE